MELTKGKKSFACKENPKFKENDIGDNNDKADNVRWEQIGAHLEIEWSRVVDSFWWEGRDADVDSYLGEEIWPNWFWEDREVAEHDVGDLYA